MRYLKAVVTMATWGLGVPLLAAPELPDRATVRIQSEQLSSGWHDGRVQIVEGCALVWTPDAKTPGGRLGLGLMFIQKLQRLQGTAWVDISVPALMKNEPERCRQGNG